MCWRELGQGAEAVAGMVAAIMVSHPGHAETSVAGLPGGLSIHCSLVCDTTEFPSAGMLQL